MLGITRLRLGGVTHWLIARFAALFVIDLSEAAETEINAYPCFNAFFTRALAKGARPLPDDPQALLSPVDGMLSATGRIDGTRLFQCKGHSFPLVDLLGAADLANPFIDGLFATLYLSPRDYHRIHMPLTGRLIHTVHIPGRLFSVNPTTVANVPGLFARNERLVTVFDTQIGPMALVLVGAIFVGSIETIWSGVVTPPRGRILTRIDYPPGTGVEIARGRELGRFNMGSTVILLLPAGLTIMSSNLTNGSRVRCRSAIGRLP